MRVPSRRGLVGPASNVGRYQKCSIADVTKGTLLRIICQYELPEPRLAAPVSGQLHFLTGGYFPKRQFISEQGGIEGFIRQIFRLGRDFVVQQQIPAISQKFDPSFITKFLEHAADGLVWRCTRTVCISDHLLTLLMQQALAIN
ncbi:MAG: hypothetical protein ACP5O7_05785 [Phycisphaerae bacterium]